MPKFGTLNIEPTQKEIREVFLKRIVQAKGLTKASELISGIMMPPPSAVMAAMKLLAAVKECDFAESVIAIDLSNAASIKLELQHGYTFVLDDWRYAEGNIKTAAKAYKRLLPVYPSGGTVNIFKDSTVVDFTPRSSAASVPPETDAPQQVTAPPNSTDEP